MKTHPELPLDLLGQGDSNSSIKLQNHLGVVRPVLGHLLHTVYPDKAREVLLNDEALHAIRMTTLQAFIHMLPTAAQANKKKC